MSGDVFATIDGYVREYGIYVTLFLALVAAYVTWVGPGIRRTFTLSRTRKLRGMEKWREQLQRLHDPKDSNRAYYGHLLSGILWVLAVGAGALMSDGAIGLLMIKLIPPPPEVQLSVNTVRDVLRYGSGLLALMIAMRCLRDYREVQRYEQTMAVIERRIATLEAKQAGQQTATAG